MQPIGRYIIIEKVRDTKEVEPGKFSSSIVSAHVFKKDFDYIQNLPHSTINYSKM